jgi:hypothetical protein
MIEFKDLLTFVKLCLPTPYSHFETVGGHWDFPPFLNSRNLLVFIYLPKVFIQ